MSVDVLHPWVLLLLPLCLLPLWHHPHRAIGHAWLALVPEDRLSRWLDRFLRLAGALAVAALLLGVSGLHRPEYEVERIGRGAHVVLLVDRSRSMDQPFGEGYVRGVSRSDSPSKGRIARDLLANFVAGRRTDLFGLVAFSTFPIPILELTSNHDIVQASIEAGNIGRGLSETNIGAGLERALSFFEHVPYSGSRIVVLVSDGAAELSQSTRLRIINMMNRLRVSLYWIYIRSAHGPRIFDEPEPGEELAPERLLHAFFSDMGAPYKAYSASSPQALEQAIRDVARLQNLPLRYWERRPREDLSGGCFAAALALLGLLVAARLLAVRRW